MIPSFTVLPPVAWLARTIGPVGTVAAGVAVIWIAGAAGIWLWRHR